MKNIESFTINTEQGLEVRMRRETAADGPHLVDLFEHLSPASRYQRFNEVLAHPDSQLVLREAERMASLDPAQGIAWLAFADLPGQPDAPIGGARYVRTTGHEAEIAVTVRDDLQGQGVGRELLRFLIDTARADGIRRLVATFQVGNRGVWGLLQQAPFAVITEVHGTEVSVAIDLEREQTTHVPV